MHSCVRVEIIVRHQIFFSEFFAYEHLLCPRRLLLLDDPEGITSEAKRQQMRSKIPGKVYNAERGWERK